MFVWVLPGLAVVGAVTIALLLHLRKMQVEALIPLSDIQMEESMAQPLEGEPSSWDEFLRWAEQELVKVPSAQPMPEPELARPRFSIYRLDERLAEAEIDCDWQGAGQAAKELGVLGPFRSDTPETDFAVRRWTKDAEPGLELEFTGLDLHRPDIGTIAIELRQPYGESFDLVWGPSTWGPLAERIRIPVPDNKSFWPLSISTKGFEHWYQSLDRISLVIRGEGEGVIEIRSLRFLGYEVQFPDGVGTKRLTSGDETRNVVYAHCPAELRYPAVTIPARGRLHVGVGLFEESGASQPRRNPTAGGERSAVDFEVVVEYGGQATPVLQERVEHIGEWSDRTISLDAWSGKTVTLILRALGNESSPVAAWANPTLYESQNDPPIVFIYLIDALSAQHINLYGYPRRTMPILAEQAEQGVWFYNMFANSTLTAESVPAILFSLPFERYGGFYNSPEISEALWALPECLHAAGFATGVFASTLKVGPRYNTGQGVDTAFSRPTRFERADWKTNRTVPIERIIEWLRLHADRPCFAYIHTMEPHNPVIPPKGFNGHFAPNKHPNISRFQQLKNNEPMQHLVDRYDEEVLYADHRFGLFLDALREEDFLQRCTFLVTADHGEAFGEHGAQSHGSSFHLEVHRIPLVAFGREVTARGRQDMPVQLFDLTPTILNLFGIPYPYPLAGNSLMPLLHDPNSPARGGWNKWLRSTLEQSWEDPRRLERLRNRSILASNHSMKDKAGAIRYVIVDEARWKLMAHCELAESLQRGWGRFQLFDLEHDFFERSDVLPTHRDLARPLLRTLVCWRRQYPPIQAEVLEQTVDFDGEQLYELRGLGYIQ